MLYLLKKFPEIKREMKTTAAQRKAFYKRNVMQAYTENNLKNPEDKEEIEYKDPFENIYKRSDSMKNDGEILLEKARVSKKLKNKRRVAKDMIEMLKSDVNKKAIPLEDDE
jgi:hypothetical protein